MQPLNDDELKVLLKQWTAPPAPATLERGVLAVAPQSWLRRVMQWLTTGSVRVPVPVGVGALAVMLFLMFQVVQRREVTPTATVNTLAAFEPVKEVRPIVIRSAYERN